MQFIFLGVTHKHLEIFCNKDYAPKGRLKAFQAMLEEADKSKVDSQKNASKILKEGSVMLYEVCCETLKKYGEHISPPPKHSKPESGVPSKEIEDSLAMLLRLLAEFPEPQLSEVNLSEVETIIRHLLRPTTSDKFRSFGFSLLLAYITLLKKAKMPVKEELVNLFKDAFPYQEAFDDPAIVSKGLLPPESSLMKEAWVLAIAREPGEPKSSGLLIKTYFQTLQRLIEDKTPTSLFWHDLVKKAWLKYLYPTLYAKHRFQLFETAADVYPPVWDPHKIGYLPLAPPAVHCLVCRMFLQILMQSVASPVREFVYKTEEELYFMTDVLGQTFQAFSKEELLGAEYGKLYEENRRLFAQYLKEFLTGRYLPIGVEGNGPGLIINMTSSIFAIFDSMACLSKFEEEEFAQLIDALKECLKDIETEKKMPAVSMLYGYVFDSLLAATEKAGTYLKEQNAKEAKQDAYSYTKGTQKFLDFTRTTISFALDICLSPSVRDDQKIWTKMREHCKDRAGIQIPIRHWQSDISNATSCLVDSLATIPEDEYRVLSDPGLNPFEGLTMKKEYALQVLHNAYVATFPPHEAEAQKYTLVYQTSIYRCFNVWQNLLRLIQLNPSFGDKEIFKDYLSTLHSVIDAFVPVNKETKNREAKEHSVVTSFPPPNSTMFDIFSPYLFTFCKISSPELVGARCAALISVCRLFCTNQSEVPLALGYLAHMIRLVTSALNSGIIDTVKVVLQNTKQLFSLDYRGTLVLIPTFLAHIGTVLNAVEDRGGFLSKTKSAAMTILASLLCIPDRYEKYDIPMIGTTEKLTMESVKQQVYGLVLLALDLYSGGNSEDNAYLKFICKAVCCATVTIYQESARPVCNAELIKKFVDAITKKCMETNVVVQRFSLSCLNSLSYLFPVFNQCDKEILENIFVLISKKFPALVKNEGRLSLGDRGTLITNMIGTLLELIMEDRYCAFIKHKEAFNEVLTAAISVSEIKGEEARDEALMLVEYIKEYYMNYPLRNQGTMVTSSLFDELEFYSLQENTIKTFHRSFKPSARRRSVSHLSNEEGGLTAMNLAHFGQGASQTLPRSSSHEDLEALHIQESGSARLYEMLKVGSPMVTQYITGSSEKEERLKAADPTSKVTAPLTASAGVLKEVEHNLWKSKTLHLGYGKEAIISVIQSPYLTSRIIVRDLTGKHAWLITEHRVLDYNCVDTIDYNDKAAVYKNVLNLKGDQKLKDMITENKLPSPGTKPKEEKKEVAMVERQDSKGKMEEELKRVESTDTFTRVMNLLTKHCKDAEMFKGIVETWEKQEIAYNAEDIKKFEDRATNFEESEQVLYRLVEQEYKAKCEEDFKDDVKSLNKMYSNEQMRIDYARSFLSHIGNLDVLPSPTQGPSTLPQLTLLNEADPDLRVLLKFLDTDCALRRSIKLGVIYVERGQFDQKSILYNTKGSAKYEELLNNLGRPLSKKDMQRSMTFQPEVLYYATAIYELVFHVITLMATNFSDTQQLEKKKYVGNDSVHIVWSENDREYKPGTITGAFNFAHIIVYPLRNGLYKVQIERKKDSDKKSDPVQFFGPLISGMQLPMEILPSLLRYTAINARKSITFDKLKMYNPMSERRKTIEKIVTKYAVQPKTKADQPFLLVDKLMRTTSSSSSK